MWSGPRNISTAMMRAWGSRSDTVVCDEPLYAHYLRETGLEHPGREEVLAIYETDWRAVVARLTGGVPDGKSVFYQKHMAHHLLPHIDRGWLAHVRNAFLVRDPQEMLSSLVKVTPHVTLADTGLPQQWEMWEHLKAQTGNATPVIDARDVLEDPRGTLEALCAALSVPFDPAMLAWEPGLRNSDGVWAKHWYAAVEASTGFAPYQPRGGSVPAHLTDLLEECRRIYDKLYQHRLSAG